MAPPRKARGRPTKKRIIKPRYSYRQHRKWPDIPRREQTNQRISVREMVYKLLNADKHNQERRASRFSKGGKFHGKMRKYQNTRELSYDSSPLRDSSTSIEESEYTKSLATSLDNSSRVMDAANSSAVSSSANSSVSNISVEPIALAKSIDNTRALLKKKSLVQVINNYIKAGIEEGKRQAKKYIRKALSFGVKSGYLIPADPQGQVIRVCPTLIESKRSDVEARKRRRRARKGEDNPLTHDKEHRRLTPPWNATQKPHRELTPKPETPPKKRRKTSDSKNLTVIKTKTSPRKKSGNRTRTGGKKGKIIKKRSNENVKKRKRKRSLQRRESDEGAESHRVRRAKSPRARGEGKENFRKNSLDFKDEGEDDMKFGRNDEIEEMSIGRRKSMTSPDDVLRNSNVPPELPLEETEDTLENLNDENNQSNSTENLN